MSIEFKNILVYTVYFFIIVFGYHILKNIMNQEKINSQIASENNVVTQVTYDVPYVLDSYDPRFIAPRYYDTQFLVYEQPVYTRSFGYYPVRHRMREHAHRPGHWGGVGEEE